MTRGMSLSDVAWFHVESEHSGYVVVVEGGKSATVPKPSAQPSAPKPGPTLTMRAKGTVVRGEARAGGERRGGAGDRGAARSGEVASRARGAAEPAAPGQRVQAAGVATGVSTGAGDAVGVSTGAGEGRRRGGRGRDRDGVAVAVGAGEGVAVGVGVAIPLGGAGTRRDDTVGPASRPA